MEVGSILSYPQESSEELRQKLLNTTVELENMKKLQIELLNLLEMAYKERDEARDQLQKVVKKLMPSTSNDFKKVFHEIQPESLIMLPATKANSSITESNSFSHVSSPVDSFLEATVSSPEFSNMNVVDSHDLGYLNHQHLVHDFNVSPSIPLVSCEKPASSSDVGNAVIDCLSKGKVLPQQGKLLQAVMDAGPLLQTLLLAGPLPTWRNPPPLQAIKTPPLNMVKDFDTPGIELNSFANAWNSFQKPTLLSSPSSMINFAGNNTFVSWNNTWQLTSNATSVKSHTSSRMHKRPQCF